MAQQPMRMALLHSTIAVVARDGLENATTKAIAREANVNEAYIYRIFEDKESMLHEAFVYLDNELVARFLVHLPLMYMKGWDFETRCRALFTAMWGALIEIPEECLFYMRYYYSSYFRKHAYEDHRARFSRVIEQISPAFRPRADVWMLLNLMLNVMLDFAVKVFDGILEDDDNTAYHVFNVVYASVKPYLLHTQQENTETKQNNIEKEVIAL